MQVLAFGIVEGIGIALIAAAFQLVYLPSRLFLLSGAAIYSAAPYIADATSQLTGMTWLGVVAAMAAGVALSLALLEINHRPLLRRRASDGAHLIASLGAYLVLTQLIVLFSGSQPRVADFGAIPSLSSGDFTLDQRHTTLSVAGAILLAALAIALHRSDIGLRLRALSDNPKLFATQGFDTHRYYRLAFGSSGALFAAAALLRQNQIGYDPYSGMAALILALAAVFIGGRRSFFAPLAAGVLVGILYASAAWFISPRWSDAAVFAALAIALVAKPAGLFRREVRLESATS